MIILGIDPGSALIGIGVVKKEKSKLEHIWHGCIKVEPGKTDAERLVEVEKKLSLLIKKYEPELAGIENLFFFKNLKTAIAVAQTRGVLLLACKKNNLKILEFTPLQVKQAVACYGRAEKKQVQRMVKMILGLSDIPKPDDAADALAIAICAGNTSQYLKS